MTVWNVEHNSKEKIDEIAWTNNDYWNLIDSEEGVFFKNITIENNSALVSNKTEAENLIKALQKAIELGWVK